MKKAVILIWLIAGLSQSSAFADDGSEGMAKHCQEHCRKAKTPEKIHKCVEKKARLNKAFRKTKCWEMNEIYEKKVAETEKEDGSSN